MVPVKQDIATWKWPSPDERLEITPETPARTRA
jgi:hypothetical protein